MRTVVACWEWVVLGLLGKAWTARPGSRRTGGNPQERGITAVGADSIYSSGETT